MLHTNFPVTLRSWVSVLWIGMWIVSFYFAFLPSFAAHTSKGAGQVINSKIRQPFPSKSRLERLGVTVVTESDGKSYGLVASFPDDKYEVVWPYLHKYYIEGFGSCGLGQCGLYVPVKDFFKAAEFLQHIKPQLQKGLKPGQSKCVWIWHD